MGLMSKLKNILFEEIEEDEKTVDTVENKPIKKEEKEVYNDSFKTAKEVSKPVKEVEELSERELFKSDTTFNFPAFDEEEFEKTMPRSRSTNILDYEKKKAITRKPETRRFERVEPEVKEKKKFKPSPVISPVYGILDKDYKPEDILPKKKEEDLHRSKGLDVDSVRKKAFGTLEEDIEKTISEPTVTFYEEPEEIKKEKEDESLKKELEEKVKTIDELLEDSATEEIIVPEEDNSVEEIEEELDKLEDDDSLAILDGIDDVEPNIEEDTLESDLFDLIDSMYEKKEDE